MTQRLIKNWWLLALGGVLYAMYSAMNFFMQRSDGSLTLRTTVDVNGTLVHMGELALAAGVCTIAAGTWSFAKGKSWLLVLNGIACSALGVIFTFWANRPIAFRTIALLIVVMAISIGIYELAAARTLRHVAGKWLLEAAGVVAVGFALAFLAMAFRRLNVHRSPLFDFLWFGSYFGFSAICMLGLALRLHGQGLSPSGRREDLPALGNPKHAH
ncbi:MAG TPA: hypothetical protein VIN93_05200 [Bryobacteraceae bacterium]|jgi:uncharacterized membrane protein HdeD (DUF308 family)